jgi:hypothetical protein
VVDVLYLQRAFGVSYQAMLYRLQNLGWLDRSCREELAQLPPDTLRRTLGLTDAQEEAAPAERGYPPRYVYLALEAYQQAKISVGKLAELLGTSLVEARELVWGLEQRPATGVAGRA